MLGKPLNFTQHPDDESRAVEAPVRSNLVIAVGDLAFRFPNILEPWTPHIYRQLSDPDHGAATIMTKLLSGSSLW